VASGDSNSSNLSGLLLIQFIREGVDGIPTDDLLKAAAEGRIQAVQANANSVALPPGWHDRERAKAFAEALKDAILGLAGPGGGGGGGGPTKKTTAKKVPAKKATRPTRSTG
jgi:hypothetical protein